MLAAIELFFNEISFQWIDYSTNVSETKVFHNFIEFFPNLRPIFEKGNTDHAEFERTIKHILRVIKVYFLFSQGIYFHKNLSQVSHNKIHEKLRKFSGIETLLILLILVYHDIGRLFDKKEHPMKSYELIKSYNLLDYNIDSIDKLIILEVIHYHLLFATIYTGESSFYGVYSLLNNVEFNEIIKNEEFRNKFVDLLEIFTFIDILGYPYAQVYDHYLKYFDKINLILKVILEGWERKNIALDLAYDYSINWINWRLAGALRIFQFVETEPELTVELYFQKLEESITKSNHSLLNQLDLKLVARKFLKPTCKAQLKYALGFLMILAFGKFSRSKLNVKGEISDRLILFWTFLSQEMQKRVLNTDIYLWNVYIVGIKNWFGLNQNQLSSLTEEYIQNVINNASLELLNDKKEYNLVLDFKALNNEG